MTDFRRADAPLIITMGDPAGVGPELIAQAWLELRDRSAGSICVLADPDFLTHRFALAGVNVRPIVITDPDLAIAASSEGLPVVPLHQPVAHGQPGMPSVADAPATIEAIHRAVALVRDGLGRAVVTAPVHKETLYLSGFAFPGHTEYLAALSVGDGDPLPRPVMMLVSDLVRTVPVTVHIPISRVPAALTPAVIVETGDIAATSLVRLFKIENPRIAVAGLNPHAGEGGQIGSEDRNVIAPAVATLREAGIDAEGPLPADTMFHAAARKRYDAALCMYHDQALIPVKALAFETAVNLTLGLSFVRTSPDHGTALPLAGTGRADPSSMVAAIRLADRLTRT